MPFNLRNHDFAELLDFSPKEIKFLLTLAQELKAAKYGGYEQPRLAGKNIALIFEKSSTRTRCAFEIAAHDQGAHVTYLGPNESQIGYKESMRDTARVLSRFYDAIEYRGAGQEIVEDLVKYADVPVYNGLTNESHPTQFLADALTMMEYSNVPTSQIAYAFLGDCRFNTANSLMIGGCKLGMDVRLCGPKSLWPDPALVDRSRAIAEETGARLLVTDDIDAAVKGVGFLYTDVWVSMGEPDSVWSERIELLTPYQVNSRLLERTGNPGVKFMHCLPAFHDRNTKVGADIYQKFGIECMEVTDEVFESEHSIVFDQAENRMHTIKAILIATLGS
ncbi:MAG TPA: ornithine carbamoyltransferase [Ktedonobacterales bacterium]